MKGQENLLRSRLIHHSFAILDLIREKEFSLCLIVFLGYMVLKVFLDAFLLMIWGWALIISYETFRMHSSKFDKNGSCDLLICDEAHRLKKSADINRSGFGCSTLYSENPIVRDTYAE